MSDFRDSLDGFRAVVNEDAERYPRPTLRTILEREQAVKRSGLRWSLAAAAVTLTLAVIPAYQHRQREREAAQARADALLMEQVNAGLARPVPRAMAPLLIPAAFPVTVQNACRVESQPC